MTEAVACTSIEEALPEPSTTSLAFPVSMPTAVAVALVEPSKSASLISAAPNPDTAMPSVSMVETAATVMSPWLTIWSLPLPPRIPTAEALPWMDILTLPTPKRVAEVPSTPMSERALTARVPALQIESLPFPPTIPTAVAWVSTLRSTSPLPASSHELSDREAVAVAVTSIRAPPSPEGFSETIPHSSFLLLSLPFPVSIPMAMERALPLSVSTAAALTEIVPVFSTESLPFPVSIPTAVADASGREPAHREPQGGPQGFTLAPASCSALARTVIVPRLITVSWPLPESMPTARVPSLRTWAPSSTMMVSWRLPERMPPTIMPDLTTMVFLWPQGAPPHAWAGDGLTSRTSRSRIIKA